MISNATHARSTLNIGYVTSPRFTSPKGIRFSKAQSLRYFSVYSRRCADSRTLKSSSKGEGRGAERGHEDDFDVAVAQSKEKQTRTPWHRDGSSVPPVARPRRAGAMVKGEVYLYMPTSSSNLTGKGKLLTTPSRLLKLILPLTTLDKNSDRKDVEPLALLVHPQQPLSYLERLIQSELPSIKNANGDDKVPSVHFRAEDSMQDEIEPSKKTSEAEDVASADERPEVQQKYLGEDDRDGGLDEFKIDGRVEKTGVLGRSSVATEEATKLRGGHGEGGVESYSGQGREADASNDEDRKFVRWSSSTEIGDFIRDAARGKEFAVEIEGATKEIRVGVPSFGDRTHYLRQRLRRVSSKLSNMASIKKQCDTEAHRGAQRVAMGGFAGLVSWWFGVYYLTFQTDLGWDTMEPVTVRAPVIARFYSNRLQYLVGLSGLMGGYLWFLYHNREISYRSALNLSISRRQMKLYQAKGFALERWEGLIREGNELRREIKAVAMEYDAEWDEKDDADDQVVVEALRKDREEKKEEKKGDEKGEAHDT
ncbi:MAG: hypothetical protein LQ340_004913 [Diploschistes diacapsis]|nr:MAG: hypothetical protein LQ340_004913 [Diploschistes diacapsis]